MRNIRNNKNSSEACEWFDKFFSFFFRFQVLEREEISIAEGFFVSFFFSFFFNRVIAGLSPNTKKIYKEHRSKLRELEDVRLKLELSRLYCQGRRFRGRTVPFHSWEHSQLGCSLALQSFVTNVITIKRSFRSNF